MNLFCSFHYHSTWKSLSTKNKKYKQLQKKTPLVYPVPKREPKTAFDFPDWPPPLCQDGRHGQANKTRPAGLSHTCSGNFKAIISYNQFSIHSNNQYHSSPSICRFFGPSLPPSRRSTLGQWSTRWTIGEDRKSPNSEVLENQVVFLGGDDSGWTGRSGGPALFNDRSRPASSDQGWTGESTSEY